MTSEISPYTQPLQPQKPKNWPLIILVTVGVIILIFVIAYFLINSGKGGDNGSNTKEQNNIVNNNSGVLPANTYDCSSDVYNCGNFSAQAEAQYVFDYCAKEAGDIHQLDNDDDGRVCETLPQ